MNPPVTALVRHFPFEAILDAVASAVAEKLRAQATDAPSGITIQQRLLTVEQAAVYLGRTKPAIQHMVGDGLLPVVRSDRRVFLDVKDLDRWIEGNKESQS